MVFEPENTGRLLEQKRKANVQIENKNYFQALINIQYRSIDPLKKQVSEMKQGITSNELKVKIVLLYLLNKPTLAL